MPIGLGIASLAFSAGSMAIGVGAAAQARKTATATAKYNAQVDISKAKQMDLDTQANITAQRAADKVYTSRQQTAYAMAGVLSSGSPLSVAATTATRMEQSIQQEYSNSQQEQEQLYSAAKFGVEYGGSQSQAIATQEWGNIFSGGASMLGTASGMVRNSGSGGGGSTMSPSAFNATTGGMVANMGW